MEFSAFSSFITSFDLNEVGDFNLVCRLCLQNHQELEDLFEAGMCDKITEITRLKLDKCDSLPKEICLECKKQVEETYKFICKIKTADQHLRSLLLAKRKDKGPELELSEASVNKKEKEDKNELFVIVVSKSETNLSSLHEDRLSNSTNIAHECFDHTYPKERTHYVTENNSKSEPVPSMEIDIYSEDHKNLNGTNEVNQTIEQKASKIFHACNKCGKSFETALKFLSHINICYSKYSDVSHHVLVCPVCQFSNTNKNLYVDHLKTHENDGLTFFKFNLDVDEFPEESSTINFEAKIFKICVKGCMCEKCGKYFFSLKSYAEHSEKCLGVDMEKDGKPGLVYSCPVCEKDHINDRTNFIKHLSSHKKENVFFVKVDGLGNPVPVKKKEKAFLNFKKTKEMMMKQGESFYKTEQVNPCSLCGYETRQYDSLKAHYVNAHEEKGFAREKSNAPSQSSGNFSSLDVFVPKAVLLKSCERTRFICDLCSASFRSKQEVAEHLKLHAGEQRLFEKQDFVCEKCGLQCSGKVNYEKHFARHSDHRKGIRNQATCGLCKKTFANRKKLGEHLKLHEDAGFENGSEGIFDAVCEICGMGFSKHSGLSRHKKLHSTDKENSADKCKLCDRNFSNQKTFDRHLAAHLNPNYFECEVCKLPLPSASGLRRHFEIHKIGSATYDCNVCRISFLSKEALACHRAHTGHVGDSKPLECNVCHEKFYVGKDFARHIKIHPKYKTTECTLCRKRLSTFQSLALHMDRHFESNGILCPHCGKRFFEERNYRRHLLTHEGIRPFSCDVQGCQKSFYTLFEIKRHKKYHFDTRDFECPHCSKKFHEANHLKVHIRTHTGEKPYVCPHCQKGFVTRTRCKQHIKLIHQGVGYDLIRSDISKKVTVFETLQYLS